jgi:predicted RNase H-like HicB family nuclease
MKTYLFKTVIEPDADKWHAYCPVLEPYGAATWGNTYSEAARHIQEVIEMIIDELVEEGKFRPELLSGI